MYYGKEKIRQMIRSILPSTGRVGAREDKKNVKQSYRRANKILTKSMLKSSYAWYTLHYHDPRVDIKDVVRQRRGKDKVNPFVRWANAYTKLLPQENRKSFMTGLVPNSTIGQHALTHLPMSFEDPRETYAHEAREAYAQKMNNKRYPPEKKLDHAFLLHRVIELGYHKAFNRSIVHFKTRVEDGKVLIGDTWFTKHKIIGPLSARKLLGLHDIEPFLKALREASSPSYERSVKFLVQPTGKYHPEWWQSMEKFLREYFYRLQ